MTPPRPVSPESEALIRFTGVLPRMPWARHAAEPEATQASRRVGAGRAVTDRKAAGRARARTALIGLATLVKTG